MDPDTLTLDVVPAKVAAEGDPWAGMDDDPQSLDPLLGWYDRDMDAGLMDAPWPPVSPKQPNEPPRVAPEPRPPGRCHVIPVLLAVAGWIAGWWLWGRPRTVRDLAAEAPTPSGSLAVVIPARNEAEVLPHLLADLAADPDPLRRVIVVDDGSDDETATIARSYAGVEVLAAPALPAGWTGKSWACDVGARAACDGPVGEPRQLVFLDADVRLAPGALRMVAAAAERHGGLFSVQPYHRMRRAYEHLSLLPNLVSIMSTGTGRRRRPPTGAFGPLLACSPTDYHAIGGHASVRSLVAEDVGLGLRFREHDLPVTIAMGGQDVRFRMYPRGVGQLVEGWTKNMASGATAVSPTWALLTALWITAAASAFLSLPVVPGNREVGGVIGLALYLAFVVQLGALGRRAGSFGVVTAIAYPLPLAAFMALFARSAWRTRISRRVTWRGRSITFGDPVGGGAETLP
ncbi:MAG: glycosyltransferase [Acidimicrobiales bacterium]